MIDTRQFRTVAGNFATGVTVISTRDPDGNPKGLTANAFTSLSLEPPLVIVCVDNRSDTGRLMLQSDAAFSVSILSSDQEELSTRFARRGGPEKYDGVDYHEGGTGAPILKDALAFVECTTFDHFEEGDHTVVVGEVHDLYADASADPLLFFRGRYGNFQPLECPATVPPHPMSLMFWNEE